MPHFKKKEKFSAGEGGGGGGGGVLAMYRAVISQNTTLDFPSQPLKHENKKPNP